MRCTTTISAAPETVNLSIYQGDDLFLRITVIDPTTDKPYDLEGYTAEAQIRPTADSDVILAQFVAEIEDDRVWLHLPATLSALLTDPGVWDCQLVDEDGVITTVVAGRTSVIAEVTR